MRLTIEDTRRLTGPNLISPGPGAILDVRIEGGEAEAVVSAWERRARQMLEAVGWSGEQTFVRRYRAGAHLVLSAPIDALYAATEVNEWALEAAAADLDGRNADVDAASAARRLRDTIASESNPGLLELAAAAAERGVMFLSDDDRASVGMGRGSRSWPVDDLPEPDEVPWDEVHDVPLVMVTGTNGKTTTVRLLAQMVRHSGRVPGFSSTDGVLVDGETVEKGDYSGPEGARAVLRRPEVEGAILEAARGGMLRRGLGAPRADGAAITNVGVDHLGEYGLHTVEQIADAKFVVARSVEGGGRLVLNADDDVLVERAASHGKADVVWVSRDPANPVVRRHVEEGGEAWVVADGSFARLRGEERRMFLPIADAPITLDGAARHNVENALVALALAPALDVEPEAAVRALSAFRPTAGELPGRTNLFRFEGSAAALVDYVHNPPGMQAMVDTVRRLPSRRRLVVLGQAGDRKDESIRELVRVAMGMDPDRVIVKELKRYLRGREPGEVPSLICDELRRIDRDVEVERIDDELDAVASALRWCGDGDLLVLPIQVRRAEVVDWLSGLADGGWRPGQPVPPSPEVSE